MIQVQVYCVMAFVICFYMRVETAAKPCELTHPTYLSINDTQLKRIKRH